MADSRKLYTEIATSIARHLELIADNDGERFVITHLAKSLAGDFKQDNMRFDTKRFLTACGIKEGI